MGKKNHESAFTLLELLLCMALIGLILSGVFGVAQGAMQLGKSMGNARVTETRISNFVTAWRDYLENVPPGITLASGAEKSVRGSSGNLFILGSQMPFVWDRRLKSAEAVEFGIVRERGSKNLNLVVRHLKRPKQARIPEELETLAELPILEGLKQMQWQFYSAEDKKWFTTWDPKKRPSPPLYLKLKFAFHADPREHEYTFWLGSSQVPVIGNQPPPPPAAPQQ
ncbi:MAG: prepilin-type N-terminal cleavage/methylation domain-containing protein [Verrucomicrobiaceae bacterium]|nr:prepilin-type N-terminal cleavage/methylation domain-containing protein [Verrucomicrobiaceae bacterium]